MKNKRRKILGRRSPKRVGLLGGGKGRGLSGDLLCGLYDRSTKKKKAGGYGGIPSMGGGVCLCWVQQRHKKKKDHGDGVPKREKGYSGRGVELSSA